MNSTSFLLPALAVSLSFSPLIARAIDDPFASGDGGAGFPVTPAPAAADPFGDAPESADPFADAPTVKNSGRGKGNAPASKISQPPRGEIFDLHTREMPLEDFVENLQSIAKQHINIVYDKAHAKSAIPALHLRGVTFDGVAQLLSTATESSPDGRINFLRTDAGYVFQRITSHHDPFAASAPIARPRLSTFALGGLLGVYEVDDVLTLINEILVIGGTEKEPTMKFHEETQTLLMVLTPDQKTAVTEAISQLQATAAVTPKRADPDDLRRQHDILMIQKEESQVKLEKLTAELAMLEHEMKKAKGNDSSKLSTTIALLRIEAELIQARMAALMKEQMDVESELRSRPPKKKKSN